jgi:hypothetical protein
MTETRSMLRRLLASSSDRFPVTALMTALMTVLRTVSLTLLRTIRQTVCVTVCVTVWVTVSLSVVLASGCGDPGTGGSGVPTAATGTDSSTGSGTTTANPAAPTNPGAGTATTPAQGTSGSTNTNLAPVSGTSFGVIELPGVTSPTPVAIEIRVTAIRFELSSAVLEGPDGQARGADRLLPGVPIRLSYAPDADLAAAAIGATGAAVQVNRAIVADSSPGQLISVAGTSRVLFDNGSSVMLSAQAVIAGNAGAGNPGVSNPGAGNANSGIRVRAWVFTQGNLSVVSRVEVE